MLNVRGPVIYSNIVVRLVSEIGLHWTFLADLARLGEVHGGRIAGVGFGFGFLGSWLGCVGAVFRDDGPRGRWTGAGRKQARAN